MTTRELPVAADDMIATGTPGATCDVPAQGTRSPASVDWIDSARVLAAFAVVLLHLSASSVTSAPIASLEWQIANFFDASARWCVPVFVMVSGALLLRGAPGESWAAFYRKRASRILAPLLFWSMVFLAWQAIVGPRFQNPPTATSLAKSLLSGKPYYHLWYLFMLPGLYLFAPALRQLVASISRPRLAGLTALMFALAAANAVAARAFTPSPSLFTNWFIPYLPYFLAGYLLSTCRRMRLSTALFGFATAVVATAAGCFLLSESKGLQYGLYFYGYLSITVIPMSIFAFLATRYVSLRPGPSGISTLANLSFGAYLIHPIFIDMVHLSGLGGAGVRGAVMLPLMSLAVFLASMLSSWVLSRLPVTARFV